MRFLLPLVLLTVPARSALRESVRVVGWNEGCAVAVAHVTRDNGQAVGARVETLTLADGSDIVSPEVLLDNHGRWAASPEPMRAATNSLRAAGYIRAGYAETIRLESVANGLVTKTIAGQSPKPDEEWVEANFNPASNCALLIFRKIGEKETVRLKLTRLESAAERLGRGREHAHAADKLFSSGDMYGAAEEAQTGARVAPELAATRYRNASALALNGKSEAAIEELQTAFMIDPSFRAIARDDAAFDEMRANDDFRDALRGQ